jgi:hypothetical protein
MCWARDHETTHWDLNETLISRSPVLISFRKLYHFQFTTIVLRACSLLIDWDPYHSRRRGEPTVCVDHLTYVVRTFEQRRKHDDKVRQNATSVSANDQWQFQSNVDANFWDRNLCEAHSIAFNSSSDEVSTAYEK